MVGADEESWGGAGRSSVVPVSSEVSAYGLGPAAFAVRAYRRGEAEVLIVSGEVDHSTISGFREEISRCLKGSPPRLVLDLTKVTFFSSVGLSALVEAHDGAAPDTVLRIVATQRAVCRPIEATALDEVLSMFPSVDEAVS